MAPQPAKINVTFTGTGVSPGVEIKGEFSVSISGFGTGSVAAQRSYDDGATWRTVDTFSADYEGYGREQESGVLYRFNCTSYTSGSINCRMGQ